ncbi:response regulator [Spirosoma arboris]|uniref:response regulator n=1 Tax=Spirosoma arboris TaxID=2682092 RepID=UPI0018DBDA41|nr:response regulator [Spirosoma arboris]
MAQTLFPEASFINTTSAKETIDHLDKREYDLPQLILLDVDLKQSVGGLDLLPQLIERFKGHVPIIIFSGIGDELTVHQAYERGAVAYTKKPSDLQGWKNYVAAMRDYWYGTTRLPTIDPSFD